MVGGEVMFVKFGNLALRGHTFSVPQMPTGITGARDPWANFAAPHLPFSTGSKNARPRGIVPCGIIATMSPAAIASSAARNGSLLPVPRFGPALLLGGELADALLYTGQRVLPTVLQRSGYQFRHATLEAALRDLLGR